MTLQQTQILSDHFIASLTHVHTSLSLMYALFHPHTYTHTHTHTYIHTYRLSFETIAALLSLNSKPISTPISKSPGLSAYEKILSLYDRSVMSMRLGMKERPANMSSGREKLDSSDADAVVYICIYMCVFVCVHYMFILVTQHVKERQRERKRERREKREERRDREREREHII